MYALYACTGPYIPAREILEGNKARRERELYTVLLLQMPHVRNLDGMYFKHKEASFESGRVTPNFQVCTV